MQVLIALLLLLELALFVSIYTLAAVQGLIAFPQIYISRASQFDPARAIAAYLLPLTAFIIAVVVGMRLNRIDPLLRTTREKRLWWASIVFLAGLILGTVGTAAVSIATQQWLHWVAATVLYVCGTLLVTAMTILDESVGLTQPGYLRKTRIVLTVLIWAMGILFAVTAVWLSSVASVAELVITALFILYFATYAHTSEFELKSTRLVVGYPASVPPIDSSLCVSGLSLVTVRVSVSVCVWSGLCVN